MKRIDKRKLRLLLLVSAVVMVVGLTFSKMTTVETRIDTNEEALRDA